jgi:hypothetical protein
MAVVVATLKTSLQSGFDLYPDSFSDAADSINTSIKAYLATATFGVSLPVFTGDLKSSILSGLQTETLSGFISNLQTALSTYLTGVSVAGGSGAGTTIAPTGNLNALLTQLNPDTNLSTSDAADYIATAVDIMAKTTSASLTIPPSAPVVYFLV